MYLVQVRKKQMYSLKIAWALVHKRALKGIQNIERPLKEMMREYSMNRGVICEQKANVDWEVVDKGSTE